VNVVLYRGEQPIDEGKVVELQLGKTEIKDAKSGQECGIKITCRTPALVEDRLEFSTIEKRERKLQLPV